jgi:hypothetical protein
MTSGVACHLRIPVPGLVELHGHAPVNGTVLSDFNKTIWASGIAARNRLRLE